MEHALLDLGASVNLILFSVYQKLGLGELKPTSVTLQLADRSVRELRGIVKDVLVKIEQFYYPVDFIVLDYQLYIICFNIYNIICYIYSITPDIKYSKTLVLHLLNEIQNK